MIISILTPTRKRPKNVQRMIDSLIDTCSGNHEIELLLRIDNDGDDEEKYVMGLDSKGCPFLSVIFVFGEPTFPNLSILWNECLEHSAGDIIQMGGDDLIYSTKNWDELVVNEFKSTFPNGIGFIYGPDGIFYSDLGTHGFVSRLWIDTLGYFTPPQGFTYFNDNWIFDIAKGIGKLHYVQKLFLNHCRYSANHNEDPNYGRMTAHHTADCARFNSPEMMAVRKADGQKLMNSGVENYWNERETK